MPAYFDTGFSVRVPMWHGEGSVLDDYPEDWDDARLKAGLMWEPKLEVAYVRLPEPTVVLPTHCPACGEMAVVDTEDGAWSCGSCDASGQGELTHYRPVEDQRIVVRDDTAAPLGVVSDQFELVTHAQMGEILEALVGQPNVRFETAGSCRGGKQVWALAYVDEPIEVAGDDTPSYPFIALLNSHDGTGACKAVMTTVRVVCWNTYQAASMEGERTGRQFIFRHTKGVSERIEQAKQALSGAKSELRAWAELADYLNTMTVSDRTVEVFLSEFLPMPPAGTASDRVLANVERSRAVFRRLYNESPTTDGHRGTALGVIDAAVEYLDHLRGWQNRDTYMGRTMLRAEPMKAKALGMVARAVATVDGEEAVHERFAYALKQGREHVVMDPNLN